MGKTLSGFSTHDLIEELQSRLCAKHELKDRSDPANWSDRYIASCCLHSPDAPKELIELKRFSLCLRRIAPQLEQAIRSKHG